MLLSPSHLPRFAALVELFTRYGLADFARQQGLRGIAPEPDETDEAGPSRERAQAFRKRLVELGPAYVKLGQVLSTRPDLLPESYIEELEQLQDDVPAVPYDDIERVVQQQLGARISKLFRCFDQQPLGSASLGQVHAAELRNGREVVVKVQRPNIRQQLADDVKFFHDVAHFLTEHTRAGRRVDLIGVIQQLERALADELDYRVEARNAAAFRRSLAEFPRILVPKVVEAYTTECVLTTERVRGVKINEIAPVTRIDHDFHPIADELTRAYLKQITIDGHFHADPHPGNIFVVLPEVDNPLTPSEVKAIDRRGEPRPVVTPLARMEAQAQRAAADIDEDIDVRLALIDFGMTARLSMELRDRIVHLLVALADNRGDDAAAVLIEVGDALPDFDRQPYVREIAALMARHYDLAIGELQTGKVLYELISISYQRGLRLPGELALLAKTLFNLDAVGRDLDPSFSPIATIREYGNHLMAEKAKREFSPRRIYELVTQGTDLLEALPHRLDVITARFAASDAFTLDLPQITTLMTALQKVANRVFSGLVLAGLLVASAMLMPYRKALGTWGFVLSFVIGIYMVLSILWTDRKK